MRRAILLVGKAAVGVALAALAAEPWIVGRPLVPFTLTDQHDRPHEVGPTRYTSRASRGCPASLPGCSRCLECGGGAGRVAAIEPLDSATAVREVLGLQRTSRGVREAPVD